MNKRDEGDAALKHAVLMAALEDAPFDGFTPELLKAAGDKSGAGAIAMARLFPDGVSSLVEAFSYWADAQMLLQLGAAGLPSLKIRERIRAAVWARLEVLRPHKEAARRAGTFLALPHNAPLAATLIWRTADAMWRAAGDTATDFNFYSKRGILSGVYSATLLRWFNDDGADETATRDFLAHRIEDVMRFEKFKAEVKARTKDWPDFASLFAPSARRRARR